MIELIAKVPTWALLSPIYFLWLLTLTVVGERFFYFYKRRMKKSFFQDLQDYLEDNQWDRAKKLCSRDKSPVGRVLHQSFEHLRRMEGGLAETQNLVPSTEVNEPGKEIENRKLLLLKKFKNLVQVSARDEIALLERNLSILGTIATIGPLFGLLGTVTGMLKSFKFLAINTSAGMSSQSAAGVAYGISEALLTTFAGLLVAIPAYIFYNYFVNNINQKSRNMEKGMLLVQEDLDRLFPLSGREK